MLGAQIFGISLNKIALLPLEIYLFVRITSTHYKLHLTKLKRNLILWYITLMLSSALALTRQEQLYGYEEKLIFNLIQYIAIYFPILLMIDVIKNPFNQFKKAIIIVSQINSIWAIVQFILWYIFQIDFNEFFFSTCLKGLLGTEWTAWNFEAGALAMRATGLNRDPAFLAILMVLGFTFTKSNLWKSIFVFSCICAMSRVGMVSIAASLLFSLFRREGSNIALFKTKSLIKILAIISLVIIVFLYLYNTIEIVQFQTDYTLTRFSILKMDSNTGDVSGTTRHIMYLPLSILTFCDFPWLEKLFGVGPRIGGTALAFNDSVKSVIELSAGMQKNAWAIECDFAEILLGSGLFGFILYYINLYILFKKNKADKGKQTSIVGLFAFGFMYCVGFNTLMNLYLIFMVSDNILKDKPNINDE
ncbi:MAG: hypothetical protein IKS96_12015 [Fibrobacter sp.]|nr:hypothetical protein [Fibrobacter sp.]